jgi:hypothetical protein
LYYNAKIQRIIGRWKYPWFLFHLELILEVISKSRGEKISGFLAITAEAGNNFRVFHR